MYVFFFQAEDGIRDLVRSRGLGDVYKRQIEIKKAIEKKFGVHVVNIQTINHPGKIKSQFRKSGRFEGRTARSKKAIVTLKAGETIELFEQA